MRSSNHRLLRSFAVWSEVTVAQVDNALNANQMTLRPESIPLDADPQQLCVYFGRNETNLALTVTNYYDILWSKLVMLVHGAC